jgi:hypothetical protein
MPLQPLIVPDKFKGTLAAVAAAAAIATGWRKLNTPCIGLAAVVVEPAKANRLITEVCALTELTTVERAKAKAHFSWSDSPRRQAGEMGKQADNAT